MTTWCCCGVLAEASLRRASKHTQLVSKRLHGRLTKQAYWPLVVAPVTAPLREYPSLAALKGSVCTIVCHHYKQAPAPVKVQFVCTHYKGLLIVILVALLQTVEHGQRLHDTQCPHWQPDMRPGLV